MTATTLARLRTLDEIRAARHREIHTRPQADCDLCPPTACPCGAADCSDVFDHRRQHAGAEQTIREVAA